jgi:hypothetical protein
MLVERSTYKKLVIAFIVFSASLPFTLFKSTDIAGHLALALIWFMFLTLIDKREFFARLYYLLFGIFFVIPPVLSNQSNFLAVGQFFNTISLDPSDTIRLQAAIFVFLIIFPISVLLQEKRTAAASAVSHIHIKTPGVFSILLVVSFSIVFIFNIREALDVYSQGYQAYFSGDLAVQKNLVVLFTEYTFIILALFGISARMTLPFALIIIYAASLILSGQRMPGAMLLILMLAAVFPNGYLRGRFFIFSVLGFGVAPPLMMTIQTLRAVGFDGLAEIDLLYFFTDFWVVIGHSLDTLKAAVISNQVNVVDVNLFARLNLTLNVVFSRVFDIHLDLSTNGFGVSFSQYFAPDLFFERNVTFASSGIAESYFALGLVGVALYSAAAAFICISFQKKMESLRPLALLTLFVFAPRFLIGVRNELFGWIFEGAIYFITMYPIYRLLKMLFVRQAALKSAREKLVVNS